MLLLQTVVSYKSFCRYKTRLIIGLNCHILCEATLLLGTGDTEAVRNVGGGAADTLDRDCSRQHQPLGLGSASIHLTSGGGAHILHTQSGQCSGFILGAVRCSRYVFCHTVPRCCRVRLQRCSWPDVRVTMSPGRCVECSLAAVRGQNMQISGGQSPAGGTTLGRAALGRDTGCQHLVMSTTSTLDREFYPAKV